MPFPNDAACTIRKKEGWVPVELALKQYPDLRRVHGYVCVSVCVYSHQFNISYFIVRLLDPLVEMILLLIAA